MRTIYFTVLMVVIWGAFYAILPKLSGNFSIVSALAICGWMSVVLAAIANGGRP